MLTIMNEARWELDKSVTVALSAQLLYWFVKLHALSPFIPGCPTWTLPSLNLVTLRKQAYSNIVKILPPENENFQIEILLYFIFLLIFGAASMWHSCLVALKSDHSLISAQNIYCGYSLEPPRRGGSNEYLQFMFLSRNKKNNVYPCKP